MLKQKTLMDKDILISQHFNKTGILGAYETAEVDWEEQQGEKRAPCFDDALLYLGETQTAAMRSMLIEGRRYKICSVFPTDTLHTPTDKMLELIDAEQ